MAAIALAGNVRNPCHVGASTVFNRQCSAQALEAPRMRPTRRHQPFSKLRGVSPAAGAPAGEWCFFGGQLVDCDSPETHCFLTPEGLPAVTYEMPYKPSVQEVCLELQACMLAIAFCLIRIFWYRTPIAALQSVIGQAGTSIYFVFIALGNALAAVRCILNACYLDVHPQAVWVAQRMLKTGKREITMRLPLFLYPAPFLKFETLPLRFGFKISGSGLHRYRKNTTASSDVPPLSVTGQKILFQVKTPKGVNPVRGICVLDTKWMRFEDIKKMYRALVLTPPIHERQMLMMWLQDKYDMFGFWLWVLMAPYMNAVQALILTAVAVEGVRRLVEFLKSSTAKQPAIAAQV